MELINQADENVHNEKEEQERTTVTKKALIVAMQKCLGVVTQACKMVDVSRDTYYTYYREDPDFKKQCDDCSEIALDFAESKLHKQIEDNIPTSTIFFLKTKGKHRGYIEKSEHDMTVGNKDGESFKVEATNLTPEEIDKHLQDYFQK